MIGYNYANEVESGSGALTPSRVVERRRRSHDVATVSIPLTQGKFALIDEEDLPLLGNYKWAVGIGRNTSYAIRSTRVPGSRKTLRIFMHRVLLGCPDDMLVDHINRDGLDNRRCNLRLATTCDNQHNRTGKREGTSPFKGVSWTNQKRKWKAQIYYEGKQHHIGLFETEADAARAYDARAEQVYGDFAYLNFPKPKAEQPLRCVCLDESRGPCDCRGECMCAE